MAEVKGRFVSLACNLMAAYPAAREKANQYLMTEVQKDADSLDPEGWYDTKIFGKVMDLYQEASVSGAQAIVTLGKKVYPTIKKSGSLPAHLKTPVELIRYEAEGFLQNHRGPEVTPRKFLKAEDREVVVEAPAPGYNDRLYEGVYLGILEMGGVAGGKVERIGNSTFKITW